MPIKPAKHPLAFLNVAQFTGVLNDNIYKLVLVFFLIELEGAAAASSILSLVGAIFVVPFLLFSLPAGRLADRFSKSRLITLFKASEVLLFLLIAISFGFKLKWAGYTLLFLLSTHSAFFGPPKYGIIPELVPTRQVSRANGLITSCTYLAIIVGTFLASFMTQMTGRHFVLVASFSLLFALIGFLSALGIVYTPPKGSKEKPTLLFFSQIRQTLQEARKERHLLVAILGSAYFLFIGSFTQLNIIPLTIESLHLSEIAGGYLFLTTALGIALGSFLSGRASKALIELGLCCLSGLAIALLFALLSLFHSSLSAVLGLLFILGVFGGLFVVPFDSFIQVSSKENARGQVIALTNLLSFFGVLLSSFLLYLFNALLGLTAASSFLIMGCATLIFSLFLSLRLSDLLSSYLCRKIGAAFFTLEADERAKEALQAPGALLVLEEACPFKAFMLCSLEPHLRFALPSRKETRSLFFSIQPIAAKTQDQLIKKALSFTGKGPICLYLKGRCEADQKKVLLIHFKPLGRRAFRLEIEARS